MPVRIGTDRSSKASGTEGTTCAACCAAGCAGRHKAQGTRLKSKRQKGRRVTTSLSPFCLPPFAFCLNASLEANVPADLEEAMLQHVGRAQPVRRRRVRVRIAQRVRPAAVEQVVEVKVDTQPDPVHGEALHQLEIQLV